MGAHHCKKNINRNGGTLKKENESESESKYCSNVRIRIIYFKNHKKDLEKLNG